MFQAKNKGFISLYFSSISLKQSFYLLWCLVALPFNNKEKLRAKFHKDFSNLYHGNESFSFRSARASLSALFSALDIGEDDEVLISAFTCLAVPTAALASGAKPVYYDIDQNNMMTDFQEIKKLINDNTKAIVIQHTLGIGQKFDEIKKLCLSKEILLIEDCALSFGSSLDGELLGSLGDASIFSFELSKTLSTGWGGMLLINDPKLVEPIKKYYDRVDELSSFNSIRMLFQTMMCGLIYLPRVFPVAKYLLPLFFKLKIFAPSTPIKEFLGQVQDDFVSKLPKTLLPLAIMQLTRFEEICCQHEKNFLIIREHLQIHKYKLLGSLNEKNRCVSPRIPFLVEERRKFIDYFEANGVEVGTWFDGPLSPLPETDNFNYEKSKYPNSSFIADRVVNLPCHARLTDKDLKLIEKLLIDYKNI